MSVVLLIHGFTGAPSSFDAVVRALPAGVRVVAPLVVGHGAPPTALDVQSFEAEVDRLAALLPPEEPAVVAGYSLGARLAFGILAKHPARVRALVSVSGSTGLANAEERAARRESDRALAERLTRDGLEAFVEHWEALPLFATQAKLPASLRAAERVRRLSHTAAGLAHSLRCTGLGEMPDYLPALARLPRPVELLAGELDAKFRALALGIAGALTNARATFVPGAGHNLLLEHPVAVAEAIVRGLAS